MCSCIMPENTTVIICCAGMGTRLGIGTTKALVDICGKPLIIRQLELLDNYDDIRVVVGFDAEKVIKIIRNYRKDIMFVFNYDYMHNGPADSLKKALLGAREYIITLDGDTIHDAADFKKFLALETECIVISNNVSRETIKAEVKNKQVISLSNKCGNYQWSGISKVAKMKIKGDFQHTYEILDEQLPIESFYMKLKEINIQEDYEQAIEWFLNNKNRGALL